MVAIFSSAPVHRRTVALLSGLLGILLWQSVFFRHGDPDETLASPYRLTASTGVQPWQQEFVYFLYYLDLYPIASISDAPREYSVEGARRLIAEQGRTLAMDRYWTIRYGELAKTYLYLPHAWFKGRPVKLRMLHANAIGFTFALLALFAAFWYVGETALGAVLVVVLGSNPFQVNAVYASNNLFGWPISFTLFVLALHVPLIYERWSRSVAVIALALGSGLLLGTFRQIRTEPVLVAGAVSLIYLTATRFRLWLRVGLVFLLGVAFTLTAAGWTAFFETKYREAWRVVKDAGGHTYDGPRQQHHFFWHALWCGLGDFDRKYGYEWSDVKAFSYAWPILQRRGFVPRGYPLTAPDECCDTLTFGVYWDVGRQYARTPQELPEYIEIMRDKVLRDIRSDPLWYTSILVKRAERIITESTPPSLAAGNGWSISLPGRAVWGWLAVAVAFVLLWLRDWRRLKTVAFSLPLAGTAILVYSDHGIALYNIAHLIAFAVLVTAACHRLLERRLALGEWILRLARPSPWPSGGQSQGDPKTPTVLPARSPFLNSRLAASVGLVAMLALVAVWLITGRPAVPETTRTGSAPEPSVAILRFENETSSEELTWVGDAVGELLAAEMSRARVRVLDPEAVGYLDGDLVWWGAYSVLNGPKASAVNVVADRSGALQVLVGRVRPAPQGLVACVELRAPGPGRILSPEHCERVDASRLFEASRDLAHRVLTAVGATPAPSEPHGSAEAFRLYAEGRRAARREMWGDAARLLDQSLELDPELRLGQLLRARVRARWNPLDPDVLHALTGFDDVSRALERLRTIVSAEPESVVARVDLGRVLTALERYNETIAVLSPLLNAPGSPPEGFGLLAEAQSAHEGLARGYLTALESQRRSRLEPAGQGYFADQLIRWGQLDKAMFLVCAHAALANCTENQREARGMARVTLDDLLRQWRIRTLRGEWRSAEQLAYRMIGLDDPRAYGIGSLYGAMGHLFQGRSRLAGALAEEAAFRLAQQQLDSAPAIRMAAEIRLERGDPKGALDLIRALRPPRTTDPRVDVLEALALVRVGRSGEADATRRKLAESLPRMPGPIARRALHQLDGEFALLRQDASAAVRSFSQAERLLSPRGFCGDHVPIWYGLGRAHLAAGDQTHAETWFKRVVDVSFERLCWPIPYARSFAQLGRIRAATNRVHEATESFESFLSLWRDADLADAERAVAKQFLESRAPQTAHAE